MYEYGSRAGIWRVARQFTERGLPATAFGCALAFERNPFVAHLVRDNDGTSAATVCAGSSIICSIEADRARAWLSEAVASLVRTVGERPLGWYCRYAPSERTRRILVEEGGFLYDSDSYADDLPFWVNVDGHAHLVVPVFARHQRREDPLRER